MVVKNGSRWDGQFTYFAVLIRAARDELLLGMARRWMPMSELWQLAAKQDHRLSISFMEVIRALIPRKPEASVRSNRKGVEMEEPRQDLKQLLEQGREPGAVRTSGSLGANSAIGGRSGGLVGGKVGQGGHTRGGSPLGGAGESAFVKVMVAGGVGECNGCGSALLSNIPKT